MVPTGESKCKALKENYKTRMNDMIQQNTLSCPQEVKVFFFCVCVAPDMVAFRVRRAINHSDTSDRSEGKTKLVNASLIESDCMKKH